MKATEGLIDGVEGIRELMQHVEAILDRYDTTGTQELSEADAADVEETINYATTKMLRLRDHWMKL